MAEGRTSVSPAAREEGVDSGVVPLVGVHHVYVLEAGEIEGLVREAADQPRLEEGRPHVLEKPFRSAFIHLCIDSGRGVIPIFILLQTKISHHPAADGFHTGLTCSNIWTLLIFSFMDSKRWRFHCNLWLHGNTPVILFPTKYS